MYMASCLQSDSLLHDEIPAIWPCWETMRKRYFNTKYLWPMLQFIILDMFVELSDLPTAFKAVFGYFYTMEKSSVVCLHSLGSPVKITKSSSF